jgi:hypothetical protein
MALDKHRAPILPMPPNQYVAPYFNQLIRTITTYFNILDSKAGVTHDEVTTTYLNLPVTTYTAVNGDTDNLVTSKSSVVRITGPTGGFGFTGIAGGVNGRVVTLINTTSQNMTIYNQNAGSSAENRIITGTGANIATTGSGAVSLIYLVDDSRWFVLSNQL